ncbi:MAG: hypothetical protein ACJ8GN_18850 [Longimicrobiaceae bacterium]
MHRRSSPLPFAAVLVLASLAPGACRMGSSSQGAEGGADSAAGRSHCRNLACV